MICSRSFLSATFPDKGGRRGKLATGTCSLSEGPPGVRASSPEWAHPDGSPVSPPSGKRGSDDASLLRSLGKAGYACPPERLRSLPFASGWRSLPPSSGTPTARPPRRRVGRARARKKLSLHFARQSLDGNADNRVVGEAPPKFCRKASGSNGAEDGFLRGDFVHGVIGKRGVPSGTAE